jgi:hypothetical protein
VSGGAARTGICRRQAGVTERLARAALLLVEQGIRSLVPAGT